MGKIEISIFENILESEEILMDNIVVLGDKSMGKTELTKQLIGSFLNSQKHVLVFDNHEQFTSLAKRIKGVITNKITLDLNNARFVVVNSLNVDFQILKDLLFNKDREWVIVVDDIDRLLINYDKSEQIKNFIDFIFYAGVFGKIYKTYTLITGRKLNRLLNYTSTRELVYSSKNYICLRQSFKSRKSLSQILSNTQIAELEVLQPHEAIHFHKSTEVVKNK